MGQISWCLWAPLVLLALVSYYPSKAQGQGKWFSSSPIPLAVSFLLSPRSGHPIQSPYSYLFELHYIHIPPPLSAFSSSAFLPSSPPSSSRCLPCRLSPITSCSSSYHLHIIMPTYPGSMATLATPLLMLPRFREALIKA